MHKKEVLWWGESSATLIGNHKDRWQQSGGSGGLPLARDELPLLPGQT